MGRKGFEPKTSTPMLPVTCHMALALEIKYSVGIYRFIAGLHSIARRSSSNVRCLHFAFEFPGKAIVNLKHT